MGDIILGVYYTPPEQKEEAEEAFYRQLTVTFPGSRVGLQPP